MSESFDLRKMEDIFACLEVITMARGALYPVDPNLANRLEKVSDALSAFSIIVDEGLLAPPSDSVPIQKQQAAPKKEFSLDVEGGKDSQPLDILSDFPQQGKGGKPEKSRPRDDEDEGIVDILTGERIR